MTRSALPGLADLKVALARRLGSSGSARESINGEARRRLAAAEEFRAAQIEIVSHLRASALKNDVDVFGALERP